MRTGTFVAGGIAIVALTAAVAIYVRPLVPGFAVPQESAPVIDVASAQDDTDRPSVADIADVTRGLTRGEEDAVQSDVVVDVDPDSVPQSEDSVETSPEPELQSGDAASRPPVMTDRRFEADGALLVSGTAQSGVPLAMLIDGIEIERVDVDGAGGFVIVAFLGYSDLPRVMNMISDPDGAAVRSDETIILAPNPAPVVVSALDENASTALGARTGVAQDAVGDAASGIGDAGLDSPETDALGTSTEQAGDQTAAVPAILSVTSDGVEVVQPSIAQGSSPQVMSTVALDTITYNPEGDVILRGRAMGQGFVQVYVDNTPISRLPVNEDGTWRGALPDVDEGIYVLRIDEIDVAGEVVSRIETPFQREAPQDVIEAMASDVANPEFTVATRTVQAGATLWAIAEERYGEGILYVTVFEANKDRIRNPDLIYPGQVLVLPETSN